MSERITLPLINPVQARQAIQTAWRHAKAWLMAMLHDIKGQLDKGSEGKEGVWL